MKSVLHKFITSEFAEKHVTVGSGTYPVKYTKDDYLNAEKVAKQFQITQKQAIESMRILYSKNIQFGVNGHKTPVVTKFKGKSGMVLHPFALDVFKDFLTNQRG